MWGPLALIIIFQPEIRTMLENLGRKQLLGRHKVLSLDEREKLVYEIMNATDYMRKSRIGGLIVIERDVSLNEYITRSKPLYADISSDLLISIFFPRNPLHDGGVIIQGNRITSAGAVFPISVNSRINKRLGTRHRAALGISEESDAIALVISEETGKISIAIGGVLNYNLSLDDARMILIEELKPKKELLLDEEFDDDLNQILANTILLPNEQVAIAVVYPLVQNSLVEFESRGGVDQCYDQYNSDIKRCKRDYHITMAVVTAVSVLSGGSAAPAAAVSLVGNTVALKSCMDGAARTFDICVKYAK